MRLLFLFLVSIFGTSYTSSLNNNIESVSFIADTTKLPINSTISSTTDILGNSNNSNVIGTYITTPNISSGYSIQIDYDCIPYDTTTNWIVQNNALECIYFNSFKFHDWVYAKRRDVNPSSNTTLLVYYPCLLYQ